MALGGLHVLAQCEAVHSCLSQLWRRFHRSMFHMLCSLKKYLIYRHYVIVHTCHGAEYLLVSLSQSKHDGGLGKHCGVDGFSVLQDAQRLVNVCSGVPHMSGKREMIL